MAYVGSKKSKKKGETKMLSNDISSAVKALKKYGVVDDRNQYEKQFNGYISSFGAAIRLSGLLPAVVFYCDDSGAEAKRSELLLVLMEMLNSKEELYKPIDMYRAVEESLKDKRHSALLLEKQIIQKAVAVKLALRLFEKKS